MFLSIQSFAQAVRLCLKQNYSIFMYVIGISENVFPAIFAE